LLDVGGTVLESLFLVRSQEHLGQMIQNGSVGSLGSLELAIEKLLGFPKQVSTGSFPNEFLH
jgi:hypothetical protein